jgi:hypothetical protein
MFEGKEVQGNIGEYGNYYADIDAKGHVEVGVILKVNLVAEAKKLAAKTKTPIDDKAIEWLEAMQKLAGV